MQYQYATIATVLQPRFIFPVYAAYGPSGTRLGYNSSLDVLKDTFEQLGYMFIDTGYSDILQRPRLSAQTQHQDFIADWVADVEEAVQENKRCSE